MGMKENWNLFIESSKAKADSHTKAARYWEAIDKTAHLILILLSAITTCIALVKGHVPSYYMTSILSGIVTVLATAVGFLKPTRKRQLHSESSKEFRTLMLRMISCETEREYEGLWHEYNWAVHTEPFVPKRYTVGCDVPYTMTPELMVVIGGKKEVGTETRHHGNGAVKHNGGERKEVLKNGIGKDHEDAKEILRNGCNGYGKTLNHDEEKEKLRNGYEDNESMDALKVVF